MVRKNEGQLTGSLLLVLMLAAAVQARAGAEPDGATGRREANQGRSETAAQEISRQIQERHVPYGTVLGPVFASPESDQIVSYSRAGDSAIWTGHYLAAESYRYKVTRDVDALSNVKRTLEGLRLLVDVTGTNLLARAAMPADAPFAEAVAREEAHHGIHSAQLNGKKYRWVGHTSRDQYCGVFFGLSVAYELLEEPKVRDAARELITRMLNFLLGNYWLVRMPDGSISTTFLHRPEQQLALLQVGRQVNPARFASAYEWHRVSLAALVPVSIGSDVFDDHNRYFKFNLDAINLFNLVRLEEKGTPRKLYVFAYDIFRDAIRHHGNAHFNMIDRAVASPYASRDKQTVRLLEEWLERPRRDPYLRLAAEFESCGPNRACKPIPIPRRIRTDFLWQRSPFQLMGGGDGRIEGPGIDFILPYWMARHFQVL